MKEELTKKMHSEFSVSNEVDIKHKAGCVWEIVRLRNIKSKEDIAKLAERYGIDYEQAIKWKDFWMNIGK